MPSHSERELHVVPRGDVIDHTTDEDCICGPTTTPVSIDDGSMGWRVTHHSLDGREHNESREQ